MADEDRLLERIAKLRDALAYIRERDPQAEAPGDATLPTYMGHTDEIRRLAERALEDDDAAEKL